MTAEDAVENTLASRQVNRIEWMTEHNKGILIGTNGAEIQATGTPNPDSLIGGDTVPLIEPIATNGWRRSAESGAQVRALHRPQPP